MLLFKRRQPQFLEGNRLNLRSLQKNDFKIIDTWLEDQELLELAFGISRTHAQFLNLVPSYKKEIQDHADSFLAIEAKTAFLIGVCSYTLFNFEKRARIGILIGNRAYWNQGYGREAVQSLLRHLFFEKNIQTIELDTSISNVRAQRCFESCGFRIVHKEWRETSERLWYELTRDTFRLLFVMKDHAELSG